MNNMNKYLPISLFVLFFILITAACAVLSVPGSDPDTESFFIYSRRDGATITVEKFEDTIVERGVAGKGMFELSITHDRDDPELRRIQGSAYNRIIEGSITRNEYEMELRLETGDTTKKTLFTNCTELRGEQLEIECTIEKSTLVDDPVSSSVRSLLAVNELNRLKVFSEDEDERTCFHILFGSDAVKIIGTLGNSTLDYVITPGSIAKRMAITEVILGFLNLALTGYFLI